MNIHVLLQIPLTVLEDKYQFCFGVDDIVEAHDVDVLELFHERDLTDGGRWGAFLGIEVYLFERHNLVCGS